MSPTEKTKRSNKILLTTKVFQLFLPLKIAKDCTEIQNQRKNLRLFHKRDCIKSPKIDLNLFSKPPYAQNTACPSHEGQQQML